MHKQTKCTVIQAKRRHSFSRALKISTIQCLHGPDYFVSKYANIQWLPTDFQFVCIAFCPHKMPCKLFWRNFGTLHNGYTLFLLAFFSSSQEVVSSSEGATMQYQPMAWSVQCYISRLKLWSIQSMIIDIKSRKIKKGY